MNYFQARTFRKTLFCMLCSFIFVMRFFIVTRKRSWKNGGVTVDHATLNRRVIKCSPLIAIKAQRIKSRASSSWRMDETYFKVKGQWVYYYRAIDKFGKTLDFMLPEQRDETAAMAFFMKTIQANGFPDKVVIDKSGANLAGLENMNCWLIDILQVKYLNNIIEQDHRFI
jgi:putative transposase